MYSKSNSTLLNALLVLLITQNLFASTTQSDSDKPTSEDITIIVRENENFTDKVVDFFPLLNSPHGPLISVKIHQLPSKGALTANFYDFGLNKRVYSAIRSNENVQREDSIRYNSGNYDGTSSLINYDNFTFSVIDGREVETESVYNVQINLLRANGLIVEDFTKSGVKNTSITFNTIDFSSKYTNFNATETINKVIIKTLPPNGTLQFQGVDVNLGDEITFSNITDFTFVPNRFWFGTSTFEYNVLDQSGDSATNNATITIIIADQRHTPVALDDNGTTTSNTPIVIDAKINDFDDDNDPLALLTIDNVLNGTATIENQQVRFVPTSGFIGNATITYTLTDNTDGTDQAIINVIVSNDVPIVNDIHYNGVIGDTIWLAKTDFINNFIDAQPLDKIQIATLPTVGVLMKGNTIVNVNDEVQVSDIDSLYLVAKKEFGIFSTFFEWNGWDGLSYALNTANVIITITNDIPIVSDIYYSGVIGDTIWLAKTDFINNFIDAQPLDKIQIATLPTVGVLMKGNTIVNVNDEVQVSDIDSLYLVAKKEFGIFSTFFEWNGWDGLSYALNTANVIITITNDIPIVSDIYYSGVIGDTIWLAKTDFINNFIDAQPLDKIQIATLPTVGVLMKGNTIVNVNDEVQVSGIDSLYLVAKKEFGIFSTFFEWNGWDGLSYALNAANVIITITNDIPIVSDIYYSGVIGDTIWLAKTDFINNFIDAQPLDKIQIATLPTVGVLMKGNTIVNVNDEVQVSDIDSLYLVAKKEFGIFSTFFEWNGWDGLSYALNTANVIITITNDIPIVSDIHYSGVIGDTIWLAKTDFIKNFNDAQPLDKIQIATLPTVGVLMKGNTIVNVNDEVQVSDIDSLYLVAKKEFGIFSTFFEWNGWDGLSYALNAANVIITITNDIPIVSDIYYSGVIGDTIWLAKTDFINNFNDAQPLDKIQIATLPTVGVLMKGNTIVNVNDEVQVSDIDSLYLVAKKEFGIFSTFFEWNGWDGLSYALNTANVIITITNDIPIVSDIYYSGVIGDTIWLAKTDFIKNFNDAQPLDKIQIATLPTVGVLMKGNTIVNVNDEVQVSDIDSLYLVAKKEFGIFSTFFEWNGWDGLSYALNTANVIITITNDIPIVGDIYYSGRVGDTIWLDKSDFVHEFIDSDTLQKIQIKSIPLIGNLYKGEDKLAVNDEINVNEINAIYFISNTHLNKVGTSFEWNGWDGLNYAIDNGRVHITIGLPFPPVVNDFVKYGSINTDILFNLLDFDDNFKDFSGFRLDSIQLTTLPKFGTFYFEGVALKVNQTIARNEILNLVYTPNDNYFGFDNVNYTANNGFNWAVNSAVIKIIIDGISASPPDIEDIYKEGPQNTDIPITLTDFLEVYSDTVIKEIYISTLPENGNLYHNDILVEENDLFSESSFSEFIYEPNLNYAGKDSISWNASNGQVYAVEEAKVHINIKPELVIYSSFSPNGDSYNDYWHIKDIEFYPNNTVTIYNRWGNVVYNDEKYDNTTVKWEGINHDNGVVGKYLTAGTYFYKIDLRDGSSIRSGFVVIAK
ncbi:gliding motility-associated C-terminal domain-containing protein [Flammeovirga pectinis]|uniref:Gliding motility-associated C-terminal domain-containing protein n=1 Tax=Flammeovirga pectinis TaxID=2494373 RepID=A0A3Q9FQQ5_9BACT|nr:gliding motility-associated C-terminal domain-containing protein [Flammeovirga pectinis]AZQ65437.1 gliding motility-associated C-terminal domain-containing protein [Flammeovirga pectinis]